MPVHWLKTILVVEYDAFEFVTVIPLEVDASEPPEAKEPVNFTLLK